MKSKNSWEYETKVKRAKKIERDKRDKERRLNSVRRKDSSVDAADWWEALQES